jgi:hypothetical protein
MNYVPVSEEKGKVALGQKRKSHALCLERKVREEKTRIRNRIAYACHAVAVGPVSDSPSPMTLRKN